MRYFLFAVSCVVFACSAIAENMWSVENRSFTIFDPETKESTHALVITQDSTGQRSILIGEFRRGDKNCLDQVLLEPYKTVVYVNNQGVSATVTCISLDNVGYVLEYIPITDTGRNFLVDALSSDKAFVKIEIGRDAIRVPTAKFKEAYYSISDTVL